MEGEQVRPLSTRELWFYGGMGALAPIVVAAIAIDLVPVFENLNPFAALGYAARCVLLFLVGGFVASLHSKETDAWRCFVIGISAPALITTGFAANSAANASKANLQIPGLISVAAAQDLPNWVRRRLPAVPVASLSALNEGAGGRFQRGFLGSDPIRVVVAITTDLTDEDEAKAIAALARVYFECAMKNPKNKSLLKMPELRDPPDPVVIRNNDEAVPIVQFSDSKAASAYADVLSRARLDPRILVSTQSRLREEFADRFLTAPGETKTTNVEEMIDPKQVFASIQKQCGSFPP